MICFHPHNPHPVNAHARIRLRHLFPSDGRRASPRTRRRGRTLCALCAFLRPSNLCPSLCIRVIYGRIRLRLGDFAVPSPDFVAFREDFHGARLCPAPRGISRSTSEHQFALIFPTRPAMRSGCGWPPRHSRAPLWLRLGVDLAQAHVSRRRRRRLCALCAFLRPKNLCPSVSIRGQDQWRMFFPKRSIRKC